MASSVSFDLDDEQSRELAQVADAEGRTIQEILRQATAEYLLNHQLRTRLARNRMRYAEVERRLGR